MEPDRERLRVCRIDAAQQKVIQASEIILNAKKLKEERELHLCTTFLRSRSERSTLTLRDSSVPFMTRLRKSSCAASA